MKQQITICVATVLLSSGSLAEERKPVATTPQATAAASTGKWKLVGWNDLGMHCMDGKDYSIYSILPPYNTFHAHLIDASGKLVKNNKSVTVTYQAMADPTGSINKSTIGKTNFWDYVQRQFGPSLALDVGLTGFKMPGATNTPQAMRFDAPQNWFTGEGVPISPYDDAGNKNYYPMMRLIAKSGTTTVATTDIVLPVSDEMDCRTCHASGSVGNARPIAGWSTLTDSEKAYKTNVLQLHDERQAKDVKFSTALKTAGYDAKGLIATVGGGKPVLCAKCHGSNALPGTGVAGVSPLTSAIHQYHAKVVDPATFQTLETNSDRTACYRCHPGSLTKCLRGAMGNATAADGSMLMQCQSCHGSMSTVGAKTRNGWLEEPNCQGCHTGTAVKNNGQIRFTSVFQGGLLRQAADQTFATNPNTPATGTSLYRFSKGHGGLQCEACHGSTHAEYPSSHGNDNLQIVALQGHSGVISECSACHSTVLSTTNGGPHGLHPIGQTWVGQHSSVAERDATQCRTCHGLDYRGTVLSKAQADRSFKVESKTVTLKKGTQIGCYSCHDGPRG